MAAYESDFTRFMREWMEKHPEERQQQREGRALWWDKPQEVETNKQLQESRVPQKSYYYQSN